MRNLTLIETSLLDSLTFTEQQKQKISEHWATQEPKIKKLGGSITTKLFWILLSLMPLFYLVRNYGNRFDFQEATVDGIENFATLALVAFLIRICYNAILFSSLSDPDDKSKVIKDELGSKFILSSLTIYKAYYLRSGILNNIISYLLMLDLLVCVFTGYYIIAGLIVLSIIWSAVALSNLRKEINKKLEE